MMGICARIVLAALLLGTGANAATTDQYEVPVFSAEELQQGVRAEELAGILATTGLISVVGTSRDQESFQKTRLDGLLGLCECVAQGTAEKGGQFHTVEGVDSAVLADGTKRTTVATATVGATPLELARDAIGCSTSTMESMEQMRDHVAWISHAFVSALDRLLLLSSSSYKEEATAKKKALLRSSKGKPFHSLQSIVHASQNLEHFHVYEKSNEHSHNNMNKAVLDFHTDAGLFLAFVPGKRCGESNSNDENEGDFYVQLKDGSLKRAVFAPGSVGIMLGVGAEHWLKTPASLTLRATRHAVTMEAGRSRAWYGMMHTVPQDAIIQDFPQHTFADMRQSMVLDSSGKKTREYGKSNDDDVALDQVAIGCGYSPPTSSSKYNGDTRIHRRRLGTVENGATCNNVTNFFCWMTCLDIPQADNAASFVNEGYSLYCLDPQELSRSGGQVSAAYSECKGGFTHNPACMGSWERTAPGVPAYEVVVDEDALAPYEESFCYGGTSMYMDGFHWTDSVCVIYLFPEWVLNTAGSLVGASIGTLFFGIALEGVIWKRREVVNSVQAGWTRTCVSSIFYGLQLTMGYLLMLVVMTYSGPLFMCVILGLMSGHFMFTTISMKTKIKKEEKEKEGDNDKKNCCEEEACLCTDEVDKGCDACAATGSTDDSKSNGSAPLVPEGSTPCCQHSMQEY